VDSCTFRILSLCSGVGGIELGFKLAIPESRTVAYIENEAFACAILEARFKDKTLDEAPIWSDIKTFDGKPWRGKVDCITGGYPCQPFSVAGRKLGAKDPRHLWPEIKRLITEIEPPVCFFENVGGHLRLGFEQVSDDLRSMGYEVKAGLFTAQEVGAPHKRERLFILAYSNSIGSSVESNKNIGELANSSKLGCNDGSNNISERYLQKNLDRKSEENQQKWQGWISRVSQDNQNVANSSRIVSARTMSERNQEQQPQEKIGGGSSELADSENAGARKHESRIWKRIKEYCSELENAKRFRWRRWSDGVQGQQSSKIKTEGSQRSCGEIMGDTNNERLERWECSERECSNQLPTWPPSPTSYSQWGSVPDNLKPAIHKLADGMTNRVDEVRACGNGVVPLVAAYAWRILTDGMHLVKDQRK